MKLQSSLFNFFDKSYIINLPERVDRRTEMKRELQRLGISDSSDGVNFFPGIKPKDKGDFPSIGARGCFLSHLEILKEAKKSNLDNVLIMEDDLTFTKLLVEQQNSIVNELKNSDWNFAYLGHGEKLNHSQERFFYQHDKPLMLAHFFCVNKEIIPQLVDFLEEILKRPAGHPEGGPMHVDGAYSTFRQKHTQAITLIAHTSLGYQRYSPSNIAGYKWFDKLPIFSQLATAARRARNWQRRNYYH